MEIQEKQEKLARGILGALLGSILGGAVIVLFSQMGQISAFSGVILAFCTLKGYEQMGGKMSKRGVVICVLVMLVMPYVADRLNWALVIVQEYQWLFGDAFLYVHEVVEACDLQTEYWRDLGVLYGFTALGAIGIIVSFFKQKK